MTKQPRKKTSNESRITQLPAGRKADIVGYVANKGQVSVSGLASYLGVSMDTIRRDLDDLDASGLLIRTHGGAVSSDLIPRNNTSLDIRSRLHAKGKDRIGKAAAALVSHHSSILINGGTTALAAVGHLPPGGHLRIITNNLQLPARLASGVADDVFMIGGSVRTSAQATLGSVTSIAGTHPIYEFGVHCDFALIGIGAVSAKQGFTTGHLAEAVLMQEMIQCATTVVILADSSKLGRDEFARVAAFTAADYLITDAKPDSGLATKLRQAGVKVVIAS